MGPNAVEHAHYLRIYMGHLRQKLETDPARPQHFITETGIGYRFVSIPEYLPGDFLPRHCYRKTVLFSGSFIVYIKNCYFVRFIVKPVIQTHGF